MNPAAPDLGQHFDAMSEGYDALIARTWPVYKEVFQTMLDFSFVDRSAPLNVLDLGCGTGNLALFLSQQLPNARFTLLDLSPEMLAIAERKITDNVADVQLVNAGFMDAELPENHYDFIVSSIALHHLPNDQKAEMYRRIFRWLTPGGQFRMADGMHALPVAPSHEVIWAGWEALATSATPEEVTMWKAHEAEYDHFVPLRQHFAWLDEAGFENVEIYWKKLLWGVFGGQKPA
ncbi:MAG: class I SAM-dependent methyltransferase [Candidatus Melainabacteria bacterium]